jgi:hypothetical protein
MSRVIMCEFCGERPMKWGGLCSAHAEQRRLGKELHPVVRRFFGTPEEVLRHYSHGDDSGCLLWSGPKNDAGYGTCRYGLAHRAAYRVWVGPIPEGLYVLHHCDVPACIEPSHLYVGTQADNMRDMAERGRRRNRPMPGESNPAAKLTEAQVRAIRADPRPQRAIAADYGISQATVSLIVRREKWAHL